ncbi:MAG TPA: tRNA lysidine(34) synthetase TilS [Thermoanaerobaculia bacterium]|nr:tRNA lysidine(34) synthetase TilS [Thermoanaerobaculia bacterium]
MGSSPVTATISPPLGLLLEIVRDRLEAHSALAANRPLIVAFSGGPDSTALLLAVSTLGRAAGTPVLAAHLDHAQDAGSSDRATAARDLARRLGADFEHDRRSVSAERTPGESWEAAARRIRYDYLENVRKLAGGEWVLTGHHQDDQAETVVLRLLFGSGPTGLGGVHPVRHHLLRPLLGLSRSQLADALTAAGLIPVSDPTNLCLDPARNRIRAELLPRLCANEPALTARLAALAKRAQGAAASIDKTLEARLSPRHEEDGLSVAQRDLTELPPSLVAPALALLNRLAGSPYPASAAARSELARQLRSRRHVRCDCGDGWYWETLGGRLHVRRKRSGCPRFSYTLRVPGEVTIPEIAARLSIRLGPAATRPVQPGTERVEISLPFTDGGWVEIRNRLPGDRLRPIGRSRPRRLKEHLIELGVPRDRRDRLPILCEAGNIAWAASVGIDERYRPRPGAAIWTVEIGSDREP